MRTSLITLAIVAVVSTTAFAGPKQQVFGGGGIVSPANGSDDMTIFSGGYALLQGVSENVFIRPFVAGTLIKKSGPNTKGVLTGAMLGYKLTGRISVLAGGGGAMVIAPKRGDVLPTFVAATAISIKNGFALLTPIAINSAGTVAQINLGYAW